MTVRKSHRSAELAPQSSNTVPTGKADRAGIEPLTYRLDDLSTVLGVSRRSLERERSAGRFPKPDRVIGRMPLWRPETIRAWIAEGSKA